METYTDSYTTPDGQVILIYPRHLTADERKNLLEWLEFELVMTKRRLARMEVKEQEVASAKDTVK